MVVKRHFRVLLWSKPWTKLNNTCRYKGKGTEASSFCVVNILRTFSLIFSLVTKKDFLGIPMFCNSIPFPYLHLQVLSFPFHPKLRTILFPSRPKLRAILFLFVQIYKERVQLFQENGLNLLNGGSI